MGDRAVGRLRENILATRIEAARLGHEIGSFRPVDGLSLLGYEAFCSRCTMSIYINDTKVSSIKPGKCRSYWVSDD